MKRAVTLASNGAGSVSPNPLVGCVIVKDDAIIGEGWHARYGDAHAEVNAVRDAEKNGRSVEGADVYVTLEPCAHHGKTSPCADLLITKKIARCFIAVKDPYKEVNGKGIEKLHDAGIKVSVGLLEEEARYLNRFFLKHVTTGMPYLTMKIAVSMDGRSALKSGASKWITSEASRTLVHKMRSEYDSVMVASATVLADNPSLTVRSVEGRNPKRVILDASLRLDETASVFSKDAPTIVLTTHPAARDKKEKVKLLENNGVEIIRISTVEGQLDMKEALRELGARKVTSILVEPGPTLATSLYRSGDFDELVLFLAPIVLGSDARSVFGDMHLKDLNRADRLKLKSVARVDGSDDICTHYLRK